MNETNKVTLDIVNRALLLCGDVPLQSLEEDTVEAISMTNQLTSVIDYVLSDGCFQLSLIDMGKSYPLGANTLPCGTHIVLLRTLGNVDNVYVYRVPIVQLPPYIVEAVVYRLSYLHAVTRHEERLVALFKSEAEATLRRARSIDARSNPRKVIQDNSYLNMLLTNKLRRTDVTY